MKRALVVLWMAAVLAPARAAVAQEAVFLVRHAERADSSADSPLSPAGRRRAARLADLLKDAGITAIYTTDFRRTIQTAAPLARASRVEAVALPAADRDALLAKIRSAGAHDRLLVVGHSNTVPDILRALGVETPVTIGEAEYDNLFVVIPERGEAPHLLRLRY
ncbi:MAG: histidine phosphatase family protein [Betaproteobacteria bacterium]